MGTLSRAATLSVSFILLSQWESTLEGKNLLLQEQILFFKSRLCFGRSVKSKSKQDVTKSCSP